MSQYENMIARQRKWMLYLLALLILGAAFSPYSNIFFGLILGSIVSFYNLTLLQKKITDFAGAIIKKKRSRGLGTTSRFAAVALAVILAFRFEEHINMIAVIIGLMTSFIVIMIDFALFTMKE